MTLLKKKFDDIDGKIDFMIEYCHTLQLENKELLLKITNLEAELDGKNESDELVCISRLTLAVIKKDKNS